LAGDIMRSVKLNIRVSRDLLENVIIFAENNNTTITALIEAYWEKIPSQFPLENAPIASRLSGSLPQSISVQDYKYHLDNKFDQ
jgi:hypothetical protein